MSHQGRTSTMEQEISARLMLHVPLSLSDSGWPGWELDSRRLSRCVQYVLSLRKYLFRKHSLRKQEIAGGIVSSYPLRKYSFRKHSLRKCEHPKPSTALGGAARVRPTAAGAAGGVALCGAACARLY